MAKKLFRKGGSSSSTRTPDTLFSEDTVEAILAVSEGPIFGLEEGARSFMLDDTPLVDSSGNSNFREFDLTFYPGAPLGEEIAAKLGGFASSTTVNTDLSQDVPVVRSAVHTNIGAIDIRLRINSLVKTNDRGSFENRLIVKIEYKKSSSATWLPAWLNNPSSPDPAIVLLPDVWLFRKYNAVVKANAEAARAFSFALDGIMLVADTAPDTDGYPNDQTFWIESDNNYRPQVLTAGVWAGSPTLSGNVWTLGTRKFIKSATQPTTGYVVGDVWIDTVNVRALVWNGVVWTRPGLLGTTFDATGNAAQPDGVLDIEEKISGQTVKELRFFVEEDSEDTYDIRVTKLSSDTHTDGGDEYTSEIQWESYEEITRKKFSWKNLAVVQAVGRATDQFTSMPTWNGIYLGRMIKVPSNYDPVTRVYTGTWDGTWVVAYSNNTAYIFKDFVENTDYGLSSLYPHYCNNSDIYEWGVWNDTPVDNGAGGTRPRWTFNDYIQKEQPARELAQYIAGAAGARYYDDGNGNVTVKLDKDDDAVTLFTQENVTIEGFNYSHTDRQTRANDIQVSFVNPNLNWQEDKRRVWDQDDIDAAGRIPDEFIAVGCTDLSEALARARYRLATNLTEKRVVTFTTTRKGRYLKFWDIILIADEDMGYGISRRIASIEGAREIALRDPVSLEPGFTYVAKFECVVGGVLGVVERTITDLPGVTSVLNFDADLPSNLPLEAAFSIEASNSVGFPKPFRVTRISPVQDNANLVTVEAIEHNRLKFNYVDGGTDTLEETDYSNLTSLATQPVDNLAIEPFVRQIAGRKIRSLRVTWTQESSRMTREYLVKHIIDGSTVNSFTTKEPLIEIADANQGIHRFVVQPVSFLTNNPGMETSVAIDLTGEVSVVPTPTGLALKDEASSSVFARKSPTFTWDAYDVDPNFSHFLFRTNIAGGYEINVGTATEYVYPFEAHDGTRAFTASVVAINQFGDESPAATLAVSNTQAAAPTSVAVTQSGDQLLVSWALPSENDYAGTRVYASQTTGFTPGPGNLVWEGYSDRTRFTIATTGNWYIRVGHYDEFKSSDIALATQATINVTSLISDPIEILFGSTESAAASAAAAAASETAAELAETNAAAAQADAEAAQAAANTSASAAATQAAAALTQATNAAASATTANTAATNANTANTNAQAAKTAAQTAETNATTQALNSANSATAASGSATAASGFATTATNSATAANGSATAAAASATAAAASATGASGSASAAATSASAANTSATNAGTSSSAAAQSAVAAQSVANRILPSRVSIPTDFVGTSTAGAPDSATALSAGTTVAVTGEGDVRQFTTIQSIYTRGAIQPVAGRTYRLTVRTRATVDGTGNRIRMAFWLFDSAWTSLGVVGLNTADASFVVADGWQTFTIETTTTAILAAFGTTANVRGWMITGENGSGTASGSTTQVAVLELKDVTDVVGAASSASAAATSASNAATSASGAATSASAANTSALNASTSASGASTSASNAATSATNAAGSASTATTQAGLAATSAGAAGTSASNAATSASSAATSATNAAGSASTATTQAGLAAGSATAAGGSATAAAGSASSAATQATNAGNSATSAAASSVSAQSVANRLLPDRVSVKSDFVGATGVGAPDSAAILTAGTVVTVAGHGDVLEFNAVNNVLTRGGLAVGTGRTFRMSLTAATTVDGTGTYLSSWFQVYDANWAALGTIGLTHDFSATVADGWQTFSQETTSTTIIATFATAAYIRARARVAANSGGSSSGATVQLENLRLQDVTSESAAAGSASAAATSASAASTSAGAAGTSASAANTSALNAATSASGASTSASNAATSATNAAGSASTATTQAGLAAGSATAAGGSATAANTSAGNAATSATNAGNSATAANTSALSAQSVATRLMPDRPSVADDFITAVATTATPDASAPLAIGTVVNVSGEGDVRQVTTLNYVATRGWLPVGTSRTFSVRSRVRITVDGTANRTWSGFHAYSSTGVYLGAVNSTVVDATHVVADGWQNFEVQTTSAAIITAFATAAYVRGFVYVNVNGSGTISGSTTQIASLACRDLTSEVNAAGSATAAATSAATATTKASEASTSASAANTSAINAATSFNGANLAAAQVGPRNFNTPGQWSLDYNTVAASMTDVNANAAYAVMGTYSGAATIQLKDPGFAQAMKPKAWYPIVAGDKIRMQGAVRALTDAAGTCQVIAILQGMDAPGGGVFKANVSHVIDSNLTVADGIVTFDQVLTVPASGSTWWQPQIYRTTTGAPTVEVISFLYENVTAKEAAATSASAASVSAANAATSESNASGSASTATTQAGLASTSAGTASGHASAASTSASTASTAATNASNSATAANTSALTVRSMTNRLLPDKPGDDTAAFTAAYTTYNATSLPITHGTVVSVAGEGNVYQITNNAAQDISTQGLMPVVSNRTYKLTARVRVTTDGTGTNSYNHWFRSFDASGTYLAPHGIPNGGVTILASAGWVEITGTVTGASIIAAQATAAYIRADMRLGGATGSTWQCSVLKFEDATAVTSADASATAAAASAVAASGSASAASTSATTAATFYANRLGSQLADRPAVFDDFTNGTSGTPTSIAISNTGTLVNVANEGDVRQYTSGTTLRTRGWLPMFAGRAFKATYRTRVTVDGTANVVILAFSAHTSDGTSLGVVNTEVNSITVASGWKTYTDTISAEKIWATYPTAAFVRARVMTSVNSGGTTSGATTQIAIVRLEDVTSTVGVNANMLRNSTAALGSKDWTVNSWVPTFIDGKGWAFKRAFGATGTITPTQLFSTAIACGAGVEITMQAVIETLGISAGSWQIYISARDSGGTFISNVCSLNTANGEGFQTAHGVTPAGTVTLQVYTQSSTFTSNNAAGYINLSRIKIEKGLAATPWSNEGDIDSTHARVTTAEATIVTTTAAVATETSARTSADTALQAQLSVGQQSLLRNTKFMDALVGSVPTGWTSWTNGTGTQTGRNANASAFAFRLTGGAGVNAGCQQSSGTNNNIVGGKTYYARATTWLQSGTYNGAGLYLDWRDASNTALTPQTISFANTPNSQGVTSNAHVGFTSWDVKVTAPATAVRCTVYFMSHWSSHYGGNTVANSIDWYEVDLVADTFSTATVNEVKTAVVDSSGAYSYYGMKVGAGNRFASIEAMASTKTNVSQLKLTADKFTVQTATLDKQVFTVTGDTVSINADLDVGGSISVGAARLKVALESIKKTGGDGAAITWASGISIGSIPEYILDTTSLAALTTGEQYSVYLTGVTATGATIYAKIITPGTTTVVTQTTDAAGGGGDPERVMAKSDSADAYDNIYNFRIVGTMRVTSNNEGGGIYTNEGGIEVSTWFNDGGGWDQGPTIFLDVDAAGFSYVGSSSVTGTYAFDVTVPVSWTNPIGAGGTYDFGVTLVSTGLGQALNDLHTVSYTKQTSSGTRSATPSGETVKITAFPRNA